MKRLLCLTAALAVLANGCAFEGADPQGEESHEAADVDAHASGLSSGPQVRYDDLPDVGDYVIDGRHWDHTNLTYFFQSGTDDIAGNGERGAVRDALAIWSNFTPLTFTEVASASLADIVIVWGAGDHGDPYPFDGSDGVLAHAFYPPPNGGTLAGDAHFDDAETWTLDVRSSSSHPIDLVTVAAHEIGHALGLGHSTDSAALMYPYYTGSHRHLDLDDVDGIQAIYGTGTTCKGQTIAGNTSWQQYQSNSLYLDVDTSACGFSATPLYFTTLGGNSHHWWTNGANSIYQPTATGFRVYIYDNHGSITPQIANGRQWHIQWKATPDNVRATGLCTGRTTPGVTGWQQYSASSLYLDVNTSSCGLSATPLYFTTLGGSSHHWWTNGANSIYQPTATGFRVYVYDNHGSITPQVANERQWHINWSAVPGSAQTLASCVGRTTPGGTSWQQYQSNSLYLDVNTSACGLSSAPSYFTSLGGASHHWWTNGGTSIYQPTATGFRVYVYDNHGSITPQIANERQWHLNWNALR
ncbi:matrixin family metalloprotease [Sorangium sp. So ce429]